MNEQKSLYPSGLSRSQFTKLMDYSNKAISLTPNQLLVEVESHFQEALIEYQKNRLINIRLAKAMVEIIKRLISEWETLPQDVQAWLAGAMVYFASNDDEEPDFTSSIGFEDDVEVLNSCLKFAQMDHLCLNPEDYDNVS